MNLKIVVQDGSKKNEFLVEVLTKKLFAIVNLEPKSPQKCLVMSDDKIKHN